VAAAMQCFAGFAVLLMAVMFGFLQQQIDRHQHSIDIVETIYRAGGDDASVAGFRYMRPSWVFYHGARIADFTEPSQVQAFFTRHSNAFVIVQESDLAAIESCLPPDVAPLKSVPKFLKSGRLVILGRTMACERLANSDSGGETAPRKDEERLTQRR
jgi:hypothetical protein